MSVIGSRFLRTTLIGAGAFILIFLALKFAPSPFRQECSDAPSVINETVSFSNKGITLHGTLSQLKGGYDGEKRPALILVHGSGPGSRSLFDYVVDGYTKAGFVVLAYDKRSNWLQSSIFDLAGDVAAGAKFLAKRPEVDPYKIGAFGVSQGGWVLPLASQASENFSFLIVITGGGASPREVEISQAVGFARHNGTPDEDLAIIESLSGEFYDVLATGEGHEALKAKLEAYKEESWYKASPFGRGLPDANDTKNWGWVGSYQPVETIENLQTPTLVLLGENDFLVPLNPSVTTWETGFETAGLKSSRVEVIEGAGHGLTIGDSHEAKERQYIPNYFDLQLTWLKEIGIL